MVSRPQTPILTIEQKIRASIGELTPSERRVARAVLAAYPIAALETLAEIAGRAEVSAPTILRWVAKLGFQGFPQFQRAVREEVQSKIRSPLALLDVAPRVDSRSTGLLAGFLAGVRAAVDETARLIDEETMAAAVEILADPRRRIFAIGGRSSHIQAKFLTFHLHQLRPYVAEARGEAIPLYYQAADLGRRDVVVAFDYRRYEKRTIEYCREAAARGASVLLVTDPWLSPIADVAERVLPVAVEVPSPFDTSVTGIALVEALLAGVLERRGPEARRRMEMLEKSAGEARAGFVDETDSERRR